MALDRRGVVGRFGIDFLATPGAAGARPCLHAVEINLRQGGTTHPFNTLKFITDGTYDEESGEFRTSQGQVRTPYAADLAYRRAGPCWPHISSPTCQHR